MIKKVQQKLTPYLQHPIFRIWVPPFAGFIAYGSWAFFINYDHGVNSAITAGLTQGGYSFVITLVLALIIEWLFVRLAAVPLRNVWVFLLAFCVLAATSTSINLITGTPNLLWTILPGLIMSSIYTAGYILTLTKINGEQ